MDNLDYTGPRINEGSKGIWLGLGDPVRDLPRELSVPEVPVGVGEIHLFCPGSLVLVGKSREADPTLPERAHPD